MKIIYGINRIKKFRRPVVALGVFDGLHKGHIRILKEAVKKAKAIKGRSIVLTFWPHPQKQDKLYSLAHRLRLINKLGIDICIVIRFTQAFSQIKAGDFIREILVKKIGIHHIYIGRDFRFGKNAEGDFKLLKNSSRIYNFKLKIFKMLKIDHKPISSTYIRALIIKGDFKIAERLLSRPVSVLGSVIGGTSLGRRLGFPTANINPHHEVLPPQGVYAVKVNFNGKKFNGICYIGTKPTLKRRKQTRCKTQSEKHIEVHIFGFRKNIYGKYLEIQFLKKIRKEKEFASLQELTKQIEKDIKKANSLFFPHFHPPQYMPSQRANLH